MVIYKGWVASGASIHYSKKGMTNIFLDLGFLTFYPELYTDWGLYQVDLMSRNHWLRIMVKFFLYSRLSKLLLNNVVRLNEIIVRLNNGRMACFSDKVPFLGANPSYEQKLEKLQRYLPFLRKMITKLERTNDPARSAQLQKMKHLHAILTDSNRK